MKKPKKITNHLNKILIINYEAEKIFLQALDQLENSVLKNFFRVSGYERNQFIKYLDSNIRQNGAIPTYPAEALSSDSKLSSSLNEIISAKDEQRLLTEIGRMKLSNIEKYQKAINRVDFPEEIEQTLKKQKDTIVKSLYSIEVHKDLFAKNIVSL